MNKIKKYLIKVASFLLSAIGGIYLVKGIAVAIR